MMLMENIEMKLFSIEAPAQAVRQQESQFNDPEPSPSPDQPSLEHPLVPLNKVVSDPVDLQHPRNTTESPSLHKMEHKGPQPQMMKVESVEIEMEVFPYTGMIKWDPMDRGSHASSNPGMPTPDALRGSPPKLKWRRTVAERRGLVVKDVVCLPSGHPRGLELSHCVPWGRERAELEALGLVTRMSIDDSWSSQEMESRLAALFKRRCSNKQGQTVSFTYLKCLQGSQVLFIPDTPPQSGWTGKQVLKITGHGPLYVLCHHDNAETKSVCVADGNPTVKRLDSMTSQFTECEQQQRSVGCCKNSLCVLPTCHDKHPGASLSLLSLFQVSRIFPELDLTEKLSPWSVVGFLSCLNGSV